MKGIAMSEKKIPSSDFEKTREQIHRQMLSTVSHDLKTPLATIIGSLEIYTRMAAKLSDEKKATLIQSALGEAYRLDSFITNILDMAKLEGGMIAARYERFELKPLLQDCLTRLGPRGKLNQIHFKSLSDITSAHTDPMLFGRAISLVLDNAIKHAGKDATITITYGRDGENHAIVRVHDTGPGVPSGKEEEIFSKYTRFAKSDQQNAGTGLGLAICRHIMLLLGGDVGVQYSPDGGAMFELRCPSHPHS